LRDRDGLTQIVFDVDECGPGIHDEARRLRSEWVVSLEGTVADRGLDEKGKSRENLKLATGKVEVRVKRLHVLSESPTPPFTPDEHETVNEEKRLAYRYLDLRRHEMQETLHTRYRVTKMMRDYLGDLGFWEIETPFLTKSTPEGARDFIVPSRLAPGSFYALPQSPQQYKQLLMAAGMEKYFQIARCMRDEDGRGDRQPEFTQLDMELSFVGEEDVMALNEKLLIDIVTKLYPEKRIQQVPFPSITYKEAMEKYKNDRPDVREDKEDPNLLAFCWVVDFPFFEKNDQGGWTFTHNPFSGAKPEFVQNIRNKSDIGSILAAQYDIVLNGFEIGGGSIRNHNADLLMGVFEIMGHEREKVEENFGHMLTAFRSGTPPHGGIAWGFDRLMMLLQNEPNIREVIAFPKTGEGRDLMMNAPAPVAGEQLRELGISLKKTEGK
jgi:aspartyl-tRNA synthetase